jgi:hypothetical protein
MWLIATARIPMLKKIAGIASLVISGVWWLGREFIKAVIFDRILHMLNPDAWPIATIAVQYGPPALLAVLGLYLLARKSSPASTIAPITDSSHRDTMGHMQNAAQHKEAVDRVVEAAKKVEELVTGKTPTTKPEATAKQERVFVPPELTPERLFSFYQDNTDIQAAERVKPHFGQWIKVTGTLGNVRPWTGLSSQVTFERSSTPVLERTWLDYTTIYMYFRDAQTIDRFKILKRGDKITVIGQLREVDAVDLHLDNCELAD